MVVAALAALLGCGSGEVAGDPVAALIAEHAARYPAMAPEDVYKLLHHAELGPAHAAPAREVAKAWLDAELASMGPVRRGEVAVEVLDPETRLARVHLRPYVAAGGDPEALLDAFLATADAVHGDPAALGADLEHAADLTGLPLPGDALRALTETQRAAGFPAIHHSAAYEAAYAPAYRVVDLDLLTLPTSLEPR